jgi:signal transduction histidine kinase
VDSRQGTLAWGLAGLSSGVAIAGLAIGIGDGMRWADLVDGEPGLWALMAFTFPVLGALLLTRTPDNRLAWVFSAVGLSRGVALLAESWAFHDFSHGGDWPLADEMAFVSLGMLFVGPVLAPLTLLWFPDGRLPDVRARWKAAQALVLVSGAGLVLLLSQAWSLRGVALVDDSAPPRGLVTVALVIVVVASVGGVLAGLAGVWSRLRGQNLVQRQQVKWYLLGGVTAFVLNLVGDIVSTAGFLNLAGTLAFEATVLIAVRRHALWDIDRILNRTVVYGLLTLTVAVVYVGTVLGLGLLLGDVGLGSGVLVAAATLATAVIVGPARRELQARVDRRFDRRTYDAVRRVEAYAEQAALVPPVPGSLEELLRDVLRDPDLRLVFRCQAGGLVDGWGRPVGEPTGETASVRDGDGELAVLEHRAVPAYEQGTFDAVRRAARAAIVMARLQAELRIQVTDLEQSRRRIVEAADAERRRVERDLHDGAQQRLVALAMKLRSEQRRHADQLGSDGGRIIDLGVSEISGSVADLRALAAGLLPGSLVSEGLGTALRELVDRQPDPVRWERHLDHRHAPEIEATAWFVAAEGLANSLKHAPGSQVGVEALCDGLRLRVSVTDNGPGGAIGGPGLTGLEDRVLACAGTLQVDSPLGVGTRLTVELPCG